MKYFVFIICLLIMAGQAGAGVSPLVVTSEFNNQNWFPLPVEQMKGAAVDTALTRISETGRFAFIYATDGKLPGEAGSLVLKVSLVEPAESAKIVIRLSLPDNQGTYVSSSSISLRNRDYKGIFDALQELGINGAEQITATLKHADNSDVADTRELEIRQQIIDLNLHVIKLSNNISALQQKNHDTAVLEQLGKLDTVISKLDAHHEYVRQSDNEKNLKLDAIYSEIKKLNIGSNTDNRPPSSEELTDYDIAQLPKLKKARKLKFDKKFNEAKGILVDLVTDMRISESFRAAINEELQVNLKLYEAEIVKNDVSGFFMRYLKNDEYKEKIKYVNALYDMVLARKDLNIKTRMEVNRKKDELNITGDSMDTASMAMRTVSLDTLSRSLRDALARHNVYRAMGNSKSGTGNCPNRETINTLMKQSKIEDSVVAYTARDQACELVLEESADKLLVFVFSEVDTTYKHKQR